MKQKMLFHSFFSTLKILIAFVLIVLLFSCNTDNNKYTTYKAIQNEDAKFVGSETCKACHQEEFKDWKNSHHDQAMKIADSTTVLADFNNTMFTNHNVKSTFFKKNDGYYVKIEGDNDEFQD
jgi:hypothetical protein